MLAVAKKKRGERGPAATHPMMTIWRKRLGQEVRKRRGSEKQEAFAAKIHISRAQLSIIENGARSYNIDPLLQALAGADADPVADLVSIAQNLNSLQGEAIAACRIVIEAFADGRAELVSHLVETLKL
jgi:transcriptional regulator with XRE-family HTH domain